LIRASINLTVAGILISIATSMKLPLSTTYVTFMVAMGTSLADKAWGRESAVYRVAGVVNVIGGWFFTAISAFIFAGVITYLMYIGKGAAVAVLLLVAAALLVRNYLAYKKKLDEKQLPVGLKKSESKTVQEIINESSDNIADVMKRASKIYENIIDGLAKQDAPKLKKSKKKITKLESEIDELRNHLFYFIKNLDEKSYRGSSFYITVLAYLTDVAQSLQYIARKSYKHVDNNHKPLKYIQVKDLQEIQAFITKLLANIEEVFSEKDFKKLKKIIQERKEGLELISSKIDEQISRTRKDESSPRNTTLYFNLLLETKDLVKSVGNLSKEYYVSAKF